MYSNNIPFASWVSELIVWASLNYLNVGVEKSNIKSVF